MGDEPLRKTDFIHGASIANDPGVTALPGSAPGRDTVAACGQYR